MDYQEEYNQMLKEGAKNQQKFRYATVAVVAFVLGFGVAWVSFKGQDIRSTKIAEEIQKVENRVEAIIDISGGESEEMSVGEGGQDAGDLSDTSLNSGVSLSVDDQAPSKSVFVKEVSSPTAVWVVIVENNDGLRGNVLGAGLFDSEDQAGLVELLRGTVEGGSYFAVLHKEDSDLTEGRSFDLENDTPLLDSDGNVIEIGFKTSSTPTE